MKILSVVFPAVMLLFAASCNDSVKEAGNSGKPSIVELKENQGVYRLYVNGEPFFVEGAGLDRGNIADLASHGANALRTWTHDQSHAHDGDVLDVAEKHGLMVMMGLPMKKERHGFDYNDRKAVQEQYDRIRQKVLEMKDHPALLGWGIGNELNLQATNMKVWNAVEEIAAYIKQADGNHPVTTMLAGIKKAEVDYIREYCPSLDFLSIQLYGAIEKLPEYLEKSGYTGPYLVTEWGVTGHWEVPSTSWNAPIENSSSEKARKIEHRYKSIILADSAHCLGSFVFLWGQKQERTPTWYGLFTEDGKATEAIDVMHYMWNGQWPENRAPFIHEFALDGKQSIDNIILPPGREVRVDYRFEDPDGDQVEIRMEILKESTDLKVGGDYERRPESLSTETLSVTGSQATIVSPSEPGPYRIFIYGLDGHNHAATGNIPFMIKE